MAIEPLDSEGSRHQLASLASYDKVVVVSAHAARLALARLPRGATRGPAWFAVGQGTAEPLRNAGLSVTCPLGDATSEGLLALPAMAEVGGQRVLIIRGEGGRDALRAGLQGRGASVDLCELYRRVPDHSRRDELLRLLETRAVDVLVAHSAEVLGCFLVVTRGLAPRWLAELAVLVPSDSAARSASEAGFGQVIRAASALPAAMVDALRGWYTATQQS